MSALVFPPPPLTIGQEYSGPNGVTYAWDGEAWVGGFGSTVPLWTDNATSALMSPVTAGRSLSLSRNTALHFGDPSASCPCIESDGDDLTLEVEGVCRFKIGDTILAGVTKDGLAVFGKLEAPVAGDLAGSLPNPTLRPGLIPTSLPPTGPAGGDLAGSNFPWPVIAPGAVTAAKLAPGVIPPAPTTLPPSGAAGGDLAGSSYPAPVIAAGAVTAAKIAPGVIPPAPTTLPPSGAAGGDLAGSSYPSPVIAPGAVTAAKIAAGVIPTVPTTLPPSGAAGGDLAGSSYPAPVLKAHAVTLAKMAAGAATGASQSETVSGQGTAIGATEATLYTKPITTSNGGGLLLIAGVTLLLADIASNGTHTVTLRLKLDGATVATFAPGPITVMKGNSICWSPTLVNFAASVVPGAHTITITGQDTTGTTTSLAALAFVALETA